MEKIILKKIKFPKLKQLVVRRKKSPIDLWELKIIINNKKVPYVIDPLDFNNLFIKKKLESGKINNCKYTEERMGRICTNFISSSNLKKITKRWIRVYKEIKQKRPINMNQKFLGSLSNSFRDNTKNKMTTEYPRIMDK